MGKPCAAKMPIESETLLGDMARLAVQIGWAREATMDDMLQILKQAEELGLVHLADNVLNQPALICNCCSCCCEPLINIKKFGMTAAQPSNFILVLDIDNCVGCGVCASNCPSNALIMSRRSEIYVPPENAADKELQIGRNRNKL